MLFSSWTRSNKSSPRSKPRRTKHRPRFRLYWRRDGWDPFTSDKVKRFASLEAMAVYVRELQRRPLSQLQARAEAHEKGQWREVRIPELARLWGEK